jgi:AcrR family transcriptional regulator
VERRILDVALAMLQEQGFSRMSIDAVAAEAGVSKPTIYRRWSTKADLATAAVAELRLSEPAVSSGPPLERLRGLLLNYRKSLLRPNGLALVGTVLAEEHHTPELLALFRERIVAPRRAMVAEALEDARREGEIRRDADVAALVTMLIGSFYARYLAGEPIGPAWVDRIIQTLRSGDVQRTIHK